MKKETMEQRLNELETAIKQEYVSIFAMGEEVVARLDHIRDMQRRMKALRERYDLKYRK